MAKMSIKGIVYTSAFGRRVNNKVDPNDFHWGADYGPPVRNQTGVPLFAIIAGPVTRMRDQYGALGVRVGTRATEAIEYWHLAGYTKGLGKTVDEGAELGEMGTTGLSTGIHVHVEHWIKGKRVDPVPFINKQASKAVASGDGDNDAALTGGLTMADAASLEKDIKGLRDHLDNLLTPGGEGKFSFDAAIISELRALTGIVKGVDGDLDGALAILNAVRQSQVTPQGYTYDAAILSLVQGLIGTVGQIKTGGSVDVAALAEQLRDGLGADVAGELATRLGNG